MSFWKYAYRLRRCRADNSPRRAKSTPAGVIRSAPCIRYHYFQKRWQGDTLFVAAHKLILNVSFPTRTSVVPHSSKFFARKTCHWTVYTDVHCSTGLRLICALRLVISERTRMSVKFNRSEICGMHKSRRWEAYTDVRFSTSYFQKCWKAISVCGLMRLPCKNRLNFFVKYVN